MHGGSHSEANNAHVVLGEPHPRGTSLPCVEFAYCTDSAEYLPLPHVPTLDFFAVLRARRTRRSFGPLSQAAMSILLWYTGKTLVSASTAAPRWEHRVPPSAGGRHPLDIVVTRWPDIDSPAFLYDPLAHAARKLRLSQPAALQGLLLHADQVLALQNGVVLWHVAQFQRTLSGYSGGESLVWRDAGALQATTCMVAEAIGLACCPLGMTGEPWVSRALASGSAAVGVGGCVVGSRGDTRDVARPYTRAQE